MNGEYNGTSYDLQGRIPSPPPDRYQGRKMLTDDGENWRAIPAFRPSTVTPSYHVGDYLMWLLIGLSVLLGRMIRSSQVIVLCLGRNIT